jgi:hypothetical protein
MAWDGCVVPEKKAIFSILIPLTAEGLAGFMIII